MTKVARKAEVAELLAAHVGISKNVAAQVLTALPDVISDALQRHDQVPLHRLVSFKHTELAGRKMQIMNRDLPARHSVKVSMSKHFRDAHTCVS